MLPELDKRSDTAVHTEQRQVDRQQDKHNEARQHQHDTGLQNAQRPLYGGVYLLRVVIIDDVEGFLQLAGFCGKLNEDSLCKRCEIKLKEYKISNIINYSAKSNNYIDYVIFMLKYE